MLARLFVIINLAVFLAYGVGFLIAPQALATHLDITLGSPSALADFRAMYGGMYLGIAVVFIRGLRDARWLTPAVFLATLTAAGLALGRIVTIAVDGMPGPIIFGFLASEVPAVAIGAWLLTRSEPVPSPASPPRSSPSAA